MDDADQTVSPSLTVAAPTSFACPAAEVLSTATSGGLLPAGAVSVRVCAPRQCCGLGPVALPTDQLLGEVGPLVDLADSGRVVSPTDPHHDSLVGRVVLSLAFAYPDGAIRIVTVFTPGGGYDLGDTTRTGPGRSLLRAFRRALLAQRRHTTPPDPADLAPPGCGGAGTAVLTGHLPLRAASACVSPGGTSRAVRLSQSQVRGLNRDLAGPAVGRRPCRGRDYVNIHGLDGYGDPVTLLALACDDGHAVVMAGSRFRRSPTVAAILARVGG